MRRRTFTLNTAMLVGLARTNPVTAVETTRRRLTESFFAHPDADIHEWNQIAQEYGESYWMTPPRMLLDSLIIDLTGLREAFRRYTNESAQRDLYRAAAVMSAFLAQVIHNLGHTHEAWRWWRTARYAADHSGDPFSMLWVRAREIKNAMGERSAQTVTHLLAEAEQYTERAPDAAILELLSHKTTALANMGDALGSKRTLTQLHERFSVASPGGYSGSLLSLGEERLYATTAYVYSRLGDLGRTENSQESALATYTSDPANIRGQAESRINTAFCVVRTGDVSEGVSYAHQILAGVPADQRIRNLFVRARDVLNAIPEDKKALPVVGDYADYLTSAFKPLPEHGSARSAVEIGE